MVSVKEVNTMNYEGKMKSRGTRSGVQLGRRGDFKKAIITLAEGETIDFYSNI
jgi:large subunit ribosomal protein L23